MLLEIKFLENIEDFVFLFNNIKSIRINVKLV